MEIKIPDEVIEAITKFLVGTPKALAALVFAWLSGHLWAYVILTYFRSRDDGKDFLDGVLGKVALGLLWYAIVALPIYLLAHRSVWIEYAKFMDIVYSCFLYGLAWQALIFLLLTLVKRRA